ncbi:MAG TPA: hypothetical protein VMS56_14460 [Thermoanaerobaculia bacterium]|nr:hypothetical protein [Thermoanaerobaculia bacterium]
MKWIFSAFVMAMPVLAAGALDGDPRDPSRPPRAALFRAAGFPTVDAPAIAPRTLDRALAGLPVDALGSLDDLRSRLTLRDHDLLILPYGSAFPLDAWWEIRTFLEGGGSLVVLGGAPFHQPVLRREGAWERGRRQPTFAHDLLVGPAERVELDDSMTISLPDPSWTFPIDGATRAWAMTVRLGTRSDLPEEHGSEAHRDAVLRPLVHLEGWVGGVGDRPPGGGRDARTTPGREGRTAPVAAVLLEIDRLRGRGAGGRWIFAPSDAPLSPATIRAIVERALEGASELEAGPVFASVGRGEPARIRVASRRPFVRAGDEPVERADLLVRDDSGREVHRASIDLSGVASSMHGEAEIATAALTPGLYEVEVTAPALRRSPRTVTTGFWVRDDALLASGPRVSASRDWLRRDGEVFPVIGTTYMASDVHRKFLFEPDPHVWDRDFEQMARLGINFVRTGLWTGWPRVMLNPGAVDEAFLRALDAYVQTAAKHGIVVNFTFFGFLPPAYGGTNPYLDPRSIEGQRELLTIVARRWRGIGWIHWDLINEPSYAPPDGLWTNRPIRDEWEKKAWRAWVAERHGSDFALLRDRWRDRSWDPLEIPWDHEIWPSAIREDRRPRKVRDFVEFTNEVVASWAAELRSILREAGGEALVTLGQDEGGTWFRPSQQLHAEAIDYTALHPWWQNDDLLASGIVAKVPEKPMLFQETGLMRLEDADGWPWRSQEHAAELLERKYAYAFASRGGGVIEWAWNINPYMAIDNESVIGFFRPDGTAKPELAVVPELADFFRTAAPRLDDFEPDPVVVVIPHSRLFMNRPAATDGFRRLVRLMSERFGVVPAALSELRLTPERLEGAKLVIVPSAEFLSGRAAAALLAASRSGKKVLFTGAVSGDPYGGVPPALAALGIAGEGRPVRLHERVRGVAASGPLSESPTRRATFDRNLQESLLRSLAPPLEALEGNVWHEPLPLEHAREDDPIVNLLAAALDAAGIATHPSRSGISARLLDAPRSILAVLVNETAEDGERVITVAGRELAIAVRAGRSRLLLFDRASGSLIAQTEP